MAPTQWPLPSGHYQVAPTKWPLLNVPCYVTLLSGHRYEYVAPSQWLLISGRYPVAPTKWPRPYQVVL